MLSIAISLFDSQFAYHILKSEKIFLSKVKIWSLKLRMFLIFGLSILLFDFIDEFTRHIIKVFLQLELIIFLLGLRLEL